ncbi:hypothetical protein BDR26DRAFT_852697 [Obelidium mucronatum]|nr:hypothetical protein BDR26DRAFT_852697 [Obelidium mucronatum]
MQESQEMTTKTETSMRLAHLPCEIVSEFFLWIDPLQVSQLRRVSKTFNKWLTSKQFCIQSLRRCNKVNSKRSELRNTANPPAVEYILFRGHVGYQEAYATLLSNNLTEIHFMRAVLPGAIIPAAMSHLLQLTSLALVHSHITGTIPPQLGLLENLKYLHLDGNNLYGEIPSEIGDLMKLETLRLSANKLSGIIPTSLGRLVNLKFLTLHMNRLDGPIPTELGGLAKLNQLLLGPNLLEGCIPEELGLLVALKSLALNHCRLSGVVPLSIQRLEVLHTLYLEGNDGLVIPREIQVWSSERNVYLKV